MFKNNIKINSTKSSEGFTLIEMLIAISIFSLVLIIATNIYVTINNSQRKVVTMQKIQDDTRFLFEAMAQEIRLGSINYDFYDDNSINLLPSVDNSILAINNQANEEVFFRRSGDSKVLYCTINDLNNCDLNEDTLWQSVTPDGVEILDLRFAISPSADPFIETTTASCAVDTDCDLGYACNATDNVCEYYSDGGNFQPKVKFVMSSRGLGTNLADESEILMQTTISTRIFSGAVNNLNHD